ncbi:MAG: TrbI/VirB10 family protein [Candidatus Omnitrophota bacterium]
MENTPDPTIEVNQKPKNIVQTNLIPIVGVVVLLVCCVIGMMFRPEPPKKEDKIDPRVSAVPKESGSTKQYWYNDDAHKNIRINPMEATNAPAVLERNEKSLVNMQEVKFRKTVSDLEYAQKLEIVQLEKKHELEEKEMEYAAIKAPLDLKSVSQPPVRPVSSSTSALGTTAGSGIPRTVDSNNLMPNISMLNPDVKQDQNRQDAKEAYIKNGTQSEDYLSNTKKQPLSPYELKAGTYIPAALITGIQSDLPGPIVAQVTSNVYDTVSGQYLLIPQGAKLVGEYDSHVSFGQNRALVVWTRLIFPDGATLNLSRMQGVDMAGFAGFYDKVDNHYLRIYGNAFMLSLVGAGYQLLNKPSSSSDGVSARDAVAASVGQRLADVSSQTMERNMNIQPTIVIRPGYKFNIVVVKDVILENITDDAS